LRTEHILRLCLGICFIENQQELLSKLLEKPGTNLSEQELFSTAFAAYHDSLISSAVLKAKSTITSNAVDDLVAETFRQLLWISKPEWIMSLVDAEVPID
jgi:hypothetical protein